MLLRALVRLSSLSLALTCPPAIAQSDSLYRSTRAEAGRPLRLGVFANISEACEVGAPPEVKVLTAPKHGTLAVRSAKLRTGSKNRCPGLEAPILLVVYQAHAAYSGPDEVAFEVSGGSKGVVTQTIKIEVGRAPGSPRKSSDTPMDL
jgi:hypothetical protein